MLQVTKDVYPSQHSPSLRPSSISGSLSSCTLGALENADTQTPTQINDNKISWDGARHHYFFPPIGYFFYTWWCICFILLSPSVPPSPSSSPPTHVCKFVLYVCVSIVVNLELIIRVKEVRKRKKKMSYINASIWKLERWYY